MCFEVICPVLSGRLSGKNAWRTLEHTSCEISPNELIFVYFKAARLSYSKNLRTQSLRASVYDKNTSDYLTICWK